MLLAWSSRAMYWAAYFLQVCSCQDVWWWWRRPWWSWTYCFPWACRQSTMIIPVMMLIPVLGFTFWARRQSVMPATRACKEGVLVNFVLLRSTARWRASSLVPANCAVSWRLSWNWPSQEKFSACFFKLVLEVMLQDIKNDLNVNK